MSDLEVIGLNFDDRKVLLSDGQVIPMTNFFLHGKEISAPEDAHSIVAGPTKEGKWVAVNASDFAYQDEKLLN